MARGKLQTEAMEVASRRGPSSRLRLPAGHPTGVIYLDESGVIKKDRFFGIGCLRTAAGSELTKTLRRSRQVLECMDELHWSRFNKAGSLNSRSFVLARNAIDAFFDLDDVSFCCMLADRQRGDLAMSHGSVWKAYEVLAGMALDAAIEGFEVVSVLADHADTPKEIRFEKDVRTSVNSAKKRLAIASVTRVHSHAADGLQLADLLLGAAMFDFRQGATRGNLDERTQKGRLCRYLLERCEMPSFRPHGAEIPGKIKIELRQRRRTRRGRRGGRS